MKRIVIALVSTWSSFVFASGQSLPAAQKLHLLDGPCVSSHAVAALPEAVKRAFASAMPAAKFAMADPGEEYQGTDVIDTPGLPTRRLIFAAHCGDRWIIHYEHGGLGHNYDVLIVGGRPSPRFLWGGTLGAGVKDLDDLRHSIALDKVDDDPRRYR